METASFSVYPFNILDHAEAVGVNWGRLAGCFTICVPRFGELERVVHCISYECNGGRTKRG